jgi:D-3-phosphoglycerate dehydrogenase / 2-oxoglutarate reductase
VLIADPAGFSPRALELLRTAAEVDLQPCGQSELRQALGTHDAVWTRLGHRIDGDMLVGELRCRVLACAATGLDHIDEAACARRGVQVVSLRGETAFLRTVRATAEHTVALALALLRRLPAAVADTSAGRWRRERFQGRELYGKTAGVVGVGRLGTLVAGYLRAFGMEVLGYDPGPDFPHDVAARVDDLQVLCARADLITVHVPLRPETRKLIGGREIAAMKPDAILINTSRGAIVDEAELLAALRAGGLAGAALDVLEDEPAVDESHPLVAYARAHENLIITPHIGGNTVESFEKTEVFLAGRVIEALQRS